MLIAPTVTGIRTFIGRSSVPHFSIFPATCQGQAAGAVAALAVARKLRPLALEILCASHFAHLQKILNTAVGPHFSIFPATCQGQAAGAVAALAAARKLRPLALEILCSPHFAHLQKILNTATTGNYFEDWQPNFIETYQPYYADGIPTFYFMEDDLDRINALVTPLDDYVSSMEAKFITGEISIEEEYDTFVATLEQYGVQEYVDIYNSYYAQ